MQNDVQVKLGKAQKLEDEGEFDAALACYLELQQITGDADGSVLFQTAGFLFRRQDYATALEFYVRCHRFGFMCPEIESIVMEAYWQANKDVFSQQYAVNLQALVESSGCRIDSIPEFAELTYNFVPYSEEKYAVFDTSAKCFLFDIDFAQPGTNLVGKEPTVYLLKNEFKQDPIAECLDSNLANDATVYAAITYPLYLVYDNKEQFVEFLQVAHFSSIFSDKRVVFLFGQEEVDQFFCQPDVLFPVIYGNVRDASDLVFKSVETQRLRVFRSGELDYRNLLLFMKKEF